MAIKYVYARMQQRYDTKANWELNNPELYDGEIAIQKETDSDPLEIRIGNNSSSHWGDLTNIVIGRQNSIDNPTGEIFNSYKGSTANVAKGIYSHAAGLGTIAYNDYMTAIGSFNIDGTDTDDNIIFAIGNGTADNRSNALSVDKNGFVKTSGIILDNSPDQTLVTKKYVDEHSGGGSLSEYVKSVTANGNEIVVKNKDDIINTIVTIGKADSDTGEIFNSYVGDNKNIASGSYSHAEGYASKAEGDYSHAEGLGTIANNNGMTVIGKYNNNIEFNDVLFQIGNGDDDTARSNALSVNKDGFVKVSGIIDDDTPDQTLVTKKYTDDQLKIELSSNEVTEIWNEVF